MTESQLNNVFTFQLMVESSTNALILVNKEGEIAFPNNQAEILFGYKKSEMICQSIEATSNANM
jgi:PAS domain S-box-containing protein